MPGPRTSGDYSERATEAALRVLVDLGQVLASYRDCVVLVGGWVPEFVCSETSEHDRHSRSIDVDLALDAQKLGDGRYAELLQALLDTRRYRQNLEKKFQLLCTVDLKDGVDPIDVEVDFLAGKEARLEKNRPKFLEGFRVQRADGCDSAFRDPRDVPVEGHMVSGAENSVTWRVIAPEDFLVMKAFAIANRDKPKDAYDLCFCLQYVAGGAKAMGEAWRRQAGNADVVRAREHLREKFKTIRSFGPQQVVAFHNDRDEEARERQARLAYELVRVLLEESEPRSKK